MVALREKEIRKIKDGEFRISFVGDAVCPLKVGDRVDSSSVIFEGNISELLQSVDLPKELGVKPQAVSEFILKDDGEIVDEKDVIARRMVSLGMAERVVRADVEGRISFERLESGILDIMSPFTDSSITAGVVGRVKAILPGREFHREIIISVDGEIMYPFTHLGRSVSAKLTFLKDGDSIYTSSDVDSSYKGFIVVTGRSLTSKLYESLVSVGVLGIVAGGMDYESFKGLKDIPIPLFITEGWGIIPINIALMQVLKHNEGKPVYLDCKNGYLLIPSKTYSGSMGGVSENIPHGCMNVSDEVVKLEKEMVVQIWDMPYWGYSGVVTDVLEEEGLVQVALGSSRKILARPESLKVIS